LWIDPQSESSTNVEANDTPSGATIWYYAFRQTTGIGSMFIDDLKVGGSFASVFTPKPPSLEISKYGNTIQISWPTSAEGFVLQNTTDIGASTWPPVGEQPTVVGDRNVVTISDTSGNRFFRLSKP
jgi:hypothetical protein